MNRKKIILVAFILMALAQWAVPGKMIWEKERVLELGKEFKFMTAPIDPSDPFRGKYIVLQYEENSIEVETDTWTEGESIYVILKTDVNGFAGIDSVSKEKPEALTDFVLAKVGYVSGKDIKTVNVIFPFDRFYMEESKAYPAEQEYNKAQLDTTKTTYALVNIKDGAAVLKDVMIDGVSIRDIVKNGQGKSNENLD